MGYPVAWWDPRSSVALRLKVFVDIFAGSRSPLTKAMLGLRIASLEPLDLHIRQSGQPGDLLDDGVFDFLLRLAWAGVIALSHLAPPCSSHSILRLRKGGPPAVRTPTRMQGVWGLKGARKKEFDDSKLLHERSAAIMHAVISSGGISVYEQPFFQPCMAGTTSPSNAQITAALHCPNTRVPLGLRLRQALGLCNKLQQP